VHERRYDCISYTVVGVRYYCDGDAPLATGLAVTGSSV
jgi:hypothetical protein